jgi:hypothetical protein
MHQPTADHLNSLFAHSFLPLINRPTRITDYSATLIDNIFTNAYSIHSFAPYILCADVADHLPIVAHVNTFAGKNRNTCSSYKRLYTAENIAKFIEELKSTNWDDFVYDTDTIDVNIAFALFNQNIQAVFNKCFPLTKIDHNSKKTPRKPWITSGLINSCITKEKWYKKYAKTPNEHNKSAYTKYRNKLNAVLRTTEREYYANRLQNYKTNLRRTWQVIRELINCNHNTNNCNQTFLDSDGTTNDNVSIATKFNQYFVNVGPSLANKIPSSHTDYRAYLKGDYKDSFYMFETDPQEITNLIQQMPSKTSSGYDEIPFYIFKKIIGLPHIANPL